MTVGALRRAVPGGEGGLWRDARRRLGRNSPAMAGLFTLAALALLAGLGPLVSPYPYDQINKPDVWVGPLHQAHLFGTDSLGRDLLVRLFVGLRVSLAVGLVSTLVSVFMGVLWGAVAGYVGGRLDEAMMRVVDVLYALPFVFFVILLMVVLGRSLMLLFVAIGAVEWLTMARIVRGQTLSLKRQAFVEAARASGVSGLMIVVRHIVPNLLGPVVVYAALTIPAAILDESFLSFLGLGVQEPLTSLGVLISQGARDMEIAPWLLVFPAATMTLALISLNFVGEGLRDALDPKDWQARRGRD